MAYETFTKRIRVKAPADVIMNYWLRSGLTEMWFVPTCRYTGPEGERAPNELAVVGDKYHWEWVEGTVDRSHFREIDFPHRFVAGWCDDALEIEVTIEAEGEGSVVSLTQQNTQEDESERMKCYFDCSEGWAFYLVNLKSMLEGGIDLRETNPDLKGLVNY